MYGVPIVGSASVTLDTRTTAPIADSRPEIA